jgi:hypothetical protein
MAHSGQADKESTSETEGNRIAILAIYSSEATTFFPFVDLG